MQDVTVSADSQSMEPHGDDVILIDVLGQALPLTKDLWRDALKAAQSRGWAPEGTAPAPPAWDPATLPTHSATWSGDYFEPRGQQVLRADALRLAAALGTFPGKSAGLARVARFCSRGSFLICPLSKELHAYLNTGLESSPDDLGLMSAQRQNQPSYGTSTRTRGAS